MPEIDYNQIQSWYEEDSAQLNFSCQTALNRRPEPRSLAQRIEHAVLGSQLGDRDLRQAVFDAESFGFRAVCCLPRDVALCKRRLEGTPILTATVLNFPLAGSSPALLDAECRQAVADGADELDMVVDLRSLLEGDINSVRDQVRSIVETAQGRTVKVILETGSLSEREMVRGAAAAEAGGAVYVKTSTGFGPRGASVRDILILRAAVNDRLGIKASGGIRDGVFARRLVEAGADLIGTSSGPLCVSGEKKSSSKA